MFDNSTTLPYGSDMTTDELLIKRRGLLSEIEDAKRKIQAIDAVLEMFPEQTASLGLTGGSLRYTGWTVAKSIHDYLTRNAGLWKTPLEIAAAIKADGVDSASRNFPTIVSTTCERLTEGGKLSKGKKDNKRAFMINEEFQTQPQ